MQGRLDMEPRRLSSEEQKLNNNLQIIYKKVRTQKKLRAERKEELIDRRKHQQKHGLLEAEIEITDEVIREKLGEYRRSIKKLEREALKLESQLPATTKLSQNQKDLF